MKIKFPILMKIILLFRLLKKSKNKEGLFSRHDSEKESIRNKYYINFLTKILINSR